VQQLPPSLRNLVQENPLTRLAALTELREVIDLLEADLVAQALRYPGTTWEAVGRALGISAAQANRRYRALAPEAKRRRKGKALPESAARRPKAIDRLQPPADRFSELSAQRDLEEEQQQQEEDEA
jgi:hypothetical protein